MDECYFQESYRLVFCTFFKLYKWYQIVQRITFSHNYLPLLKYLHKKTFAIFYLAIKLTFQHGTRIFIRD